MTAAQPRIQVRRVYDQSEAADGARVLVDRIWPRGISKDAAGLEEWAKDVAPSTELRRWYGHDPDRFEEFRRRYLAELDQPEPRAAVSRLRALAARGPVTLLTATRDLSLSQAASWPITSGRRPRPCPAASGQGGADGFSEPAGHAFGRDRIGRLHHHPDRRLGAAQPDQDPAEGAQLRLGGGHGGGELGRGTHPGFVHA